MFTMALLYGCYYYEGFYIAKWLRGSASMF